jgi:tRNA-uridine 2-sulfurtransferase
MTVVVGMSGGVDSSVAALLLKQQGYRVIGLFMKNWEETDSQGVCKASREYEDAVSVCEAIGIPYYSVNFAQEYWDQVFTHFLDECRLGHTPNPDILCNREIKFKALFDKACELGADYLATGHYCQTQQGKLLNQLLKGADPGKDQSYFLHAIQGDVLAHVLFPIGHLKKTEVRALARAHGLPTSEKRDSTGICFIGKRDFKEFLSRYIAFTPGNFETPEGKLVGRHDGIAYYTIGQRKGLGIGGPGDAWYVVGKEPARNVVIIAQGDKHPALYCDSLTACELSWIGTPPLTPFSCHAKIRYRQADQPCTLQSIDNGLATVTFPKPQRAATPRQSIVFYDGNICLGGGFIATPGPSYYSLGRTVL